MSMPDKCCSIAPYFKVSSENMAAFKAICQQMVTKASEEPGCFYYGFSFCDDQAHCREGYADAEALLAHIQNIGPLLEEAMKISEMTRMEIHGPEAELTKLREPLAHLKAQFFVLEDGYRR